MSRTTFQIPWGINELRDMISPPGNDTAKGRAVPEPYYTFGLERLRAAWWVLTGRAHAIVWPEPGDLERALSRPLARKVPTPPTAGDGHE